MDPGNSVRTDRIAACTSIGKKKNDPNISDRFSFGGDDGNRTRVRKHFRRTFSERIFCFKISPLKTPRSRLFHQLSRCSLMLPGFHMKFSCMLDTVHPAYR